MSIIKLENVNFEYTENKETLKNVSFSVEKGEFVAILGHNGSGKSTLTKLIMGLLIPKSGNIIVNGITLNEDTINKVRADLGIVFQNPDNQFVGITVKDDIAFGLENRKVPRDEMIDKINHYASLVGMGKFLERNPETLSGGEKQRVAIAGVLACNPEVIIFDEATSMLDPKAVKELLDTIKTLKGDKTILYITHSLNEALLADKIIVMKNGEIILEGSKEEVFNKVDILKDASLDILDEIKLIKLIEQNGIKNQKEIVELLWQLAYQM